MPKCKNSNCNKLAAQGSNLCAEHFVARELRRRATNQMPRCLGCGNVAPLHQPYCNSCETDRDARSAKQREFHVANTFEDLKEWIRRYVL